MTYPTFIADPPEVRQARKEAALAHLRYQDARKGRRASDRLRKAWVLAKARADALAAKSVRHG